MSEMVRTFICIDLPARIKARLDALEQSLKAQSRGKVSWVKPDNIHLTLRFLGDTPNTRIGDVAACVERAAQGTPRFSVTAGNTGAFPNVRNARVFWVGLKNSTEQLLPLQKRIGRELEAAGFGREDKPFSPHLTIGRARQGNAREVAEAMTQAGFADEPFEIDEIIVMRSQLSAGGSIYTPMAKIKLIG